MNVRPGIMNSVSGLDKSAAHRKCAPRSSIALRIIVKNPKNTGICTSIGRQPLIGLTLCFL